jgi:predicted RNA-binding Zn ribbon-like protein
VYVTPGHHDEEVRLTLDAATDIANALLDAPDGRVEVRRMLHEHGFTRAAEASDPSVHRVDERMRALLPRLRTLAGGDVDHAVEWVNDELGAITIEPSLTSHHGAPLHIHWTRSASTFDDQVMADVLMAIAQELVDHGTDRFGTCAAEHCEHLFYDATRNRSRRFCSDPRCASRTHTAHHRARQRQR